MEDLIVGIDLGTTNSSLAVVANGKVQVVPIHGQPTMPSCVGLSPTGELIVGQTAKNQLVSAPEATVLSIKRRMGEEAKIPLGPHSFAPEEISSFILRELKKEAEKSLGRAVRKAVITVPAYFNERQRKATQQAGELADLEVLRIINEPTAAALAYGADRAEHETLLVYDLGGGTFDVSLVTVEKGIVEVKASHGDTHLGGDDFDELLVNHAVLQFQQLHNFDLHQDARVLRRLKVSLEKAKCRLSNEPFVRVHEEYITSEQHLELEINRGDYEGLIQHLLEKTLTCLHQSLQDGQLTPRDVSKVMLVGGSTRTPLVHRLLKDRFKLEPRWEINPDLIVAMGAAIQADILAGKNRHSILVDITPHTFSTGALGSHEHLRRLVCVPIIQRNTPLPTSKSEIFFTVTDAQESIEVTAYQGEHSLPEENALIGEFHVNGLSLVPAGNPVIIHFELDLNGMLKVTATEKKTGLSKTVTMDTRCKAGELDLQQARKNIAALLENETPQPAAYLADSTAGSETDSNSDAGSAAPEPSLDESARATLETAKNLRKRSQALLERSIAPEDAEDLRKLIQACAEAIRLRNWNLLSAKNEALSDLVFYLED